VLFWLDDKVIGTSTTGTLDQFSWSWDTTLVADGTHDIGVQAIDLSGNQSLLRLLSVDLSNGNVVPVDDTSPPTLILTAPEEGSVVNGSINIAAIVSDNVGVESVKFYVDGALIDVDVSGPFSILWDSMTVPDGVYTISAEAVDVAGNTSGMSSIQIIVNNNDKIPPAVRIISPQDGTTVSGFEDLSADAIDNVGVSRVDFYVDGDFVGTDATYPYSFSWDSTTVANGLRTITAVAYDETGNESTVINGENQIVVTVNN